MSILHKMHGPALAGPEETEMAKQIVESKDKQVRKEGRAALGTLKSLLTRPTTEDCNRKAFEAFMCLLTSLSTSRASLDRQVEDYIEHLWHEGEGISLTGDTTSAHQHFQKVSSCCFLPTNQSCTAIDVRHSNPFNCPHELGLESAVNLAQKARALDPPHPPPECRRKEMFFLHNLLMLQVVGTKCLLLRDQ